MPGPLPMPTFIIREGVASDIPGIMRLKLELAISDGIAYTVRATAADWERDGFGVVDGARSRHRSAIG